MIGSSIGNQNSSFGNAAISPAATNSPSDKKSIPSLQTIYWIVGIIVALITIWAFVKQFFIPN